MDSEDLGEGLLGQTPPLPVGTDVPADLLLEVSFCHIGKPEGLLLEGLQTYEWHRWCRKEKSRLPIRPKGRTEVEP